MSKKLLLDSVTVILVVCAALVSVATVRRELYGARPSSGIPFVSTQKDWADYANAGHALGSNSAPVTIVEFSDFECPFCGRFAVFVDSLRALGRDVRVIYRHLPGAAHRFAVPAVRASECGAELGKFEPMHAALFKHSDSLGV